MTTNKSRRMSWSGTLPATSDQPRLPAPGDGLTPELREALTVAFPAGVPDHVTVLLRPH